ncbi:MAG: hypothetical protein ABDH37_08820 [Candidatus Hydrothermales bacterium]
MVGLNYPFLFTFSFLFGYPENEGITIALGTRLIYTQFFCLNYNFKKYTISQGVYTHNYFKAIGYYIGFGYVNH